MEKVENCKQKIEANTQKIKENSQKIDASNLKIFANNQTSDDNRKKVDALTATVGIHDVIIQGLQIMGNNTTFALDIQGKGKMIEMFVIVISLLEGGGISIEAHTSSGERGTKILGSGRRGLISI